MIFRCVAMLILWINIGSELLLASSSMQYLSVMTEHQWIEKMKNIDKRNIFGFVIFRSGLKYDSEKPLCKTSKIEL